MVTPAGTGVTSIYVASAMLIVSYLTLFARLAVRRWIKPEAMGVDDYLMVFGLMLYSVTCALVITCAFYGSGQASKYLTQAEIMQGTKLFFVAEFFYAGCTGPIKGSICVCLLRIADARRRFVWSLWGIMGLTTVAPVIFILTISNICHPITKLWGESPGTCNNKLNSNISFFFSAVSIFTDWAMAILPAFLLWNVRLKWRVKGSVAFILGLAAFASCATIVRLRYLALYNDPSEFMLSTGQIGMWSVIEEGIGITAGSMPALRPILSLPIFNGLSRNGGSSSGAGTMRSTANGLRIPGQQTDDGVGMDTLRSQRNIRHKNHVSGDSESQKYILKETQVSVTAEPYGGGDDWKKQQTLGWTNSDGSD